MADQKLSQLPAGGAIQDADLSYWDQAAASVSQPASALATYLFGKVSGDATATSGGAVTVSKTGGVAFAASATTDTTQAGNISSGTLPDARLSNTIAAAGPIGDASHVAAITFDAKGRLTTVSSVAIAIASGAVSGLAASATTDTTNAANISSGTLPDARLSNGVQIHPGYVATGTPWYLPVVPGASEAGGSTTPVASTTTYLVLGFVPKKMTISSLAARVTTQGTSNFQLGIYNHNVSTGHPGTLVDHTGNIANNVVASTNVSGALGGNQQLEGWYWFALQTNDATVRYAAYAATARMMAGAALIGSTTLANVLNTINFIGGLSTLQGFGTWGDLSAATFTDITTSLPPIIAMQIFSVP